MKKQLNEEFRKMQKIAGIIKENNPSPGLITFQQLKDAVESLYIEYISDMDAANDVEGMSMEDSEFLGVNNIDELVNRLDGLGWNGSEAYDFIFDAILRY